MAHMNDEKVVPYSNLKEGKKKQVEMMFDNIAHRYDLLNLILSFGIFKYWLNELVKIATDSKPARVLDVATGTGDVAIALARKKVQSVTGLDLSPEMLRFASIKVAKEKLSHQVNFIKGDGENLPFNENEFPIITVAYGVRNFENLEQGLKELYRVLAPDGRLIILEFSTPRSKFIKKVFGFYFNKICPLIGKLIAGDGSAYTYLPKSVQIFPYGNTFTDLLLKNGFQTATCKSLTFGIASLYTAVK